MAKVTYVVQVWKKSPTSSTERWFDKRSFSRPQWAENLVGRIRARRVRVIQRKVEEQVWWTSSKKKGDPK